MKKTIGIVGGGQLGRMLADAAHKLDFDVIVLDPTPNSPAGQVAEQMIGDFKDGNMIRELAKRSDYMTFEIESANAEALHELEEAGRIIHPSPSTLSIIKNKYGQKKFLEQKGIPVADSVEVVSREDIINTSADFGFPLLLKAKFDAYDGRGNALLNGEEDIDAALEKLNKGNLYVEKFVPFVKELAVVVARSIDGSILPFPVVETIHKNNICHIVMSPAPIDPAVAQKAEDVAIEVMKHLKGVGIFCIEMFLTEDGEIVVNEIAPRVHNSGHLTIEGHKTSQFEQHIRAITGMPLGDVERNSDAAVMINILGERSGTAEPEGLNSVEALGNAAVHIYGKLETRPERKMGHITIVDSNLHTALEKAKLARSLVTI